MTNEQIIANTAVAAGIYTEEEIEAFYEAGKEVPFHTLKGWAARGNYRVKAGEHGVEALLWKKKDRNSSEDMEEVSREDTEGRDNDFYLVKSYLFSVDQVEKVKEEARCAV